MVKQLVTVIFALVFFSSCTALKQMSFTSNKQVNAINEPVQLAPSKTRFIEDISITPQAAEPAASRENVKGKKMAVVAEQPVVKSGPAVIPNIYAGQTPAIEFAAPVLFKYALLLDTELETLPNKTLLDAVDEWYGVRYRSGGTTKNGVDCSAFTGAVYAAAYGTTLPRVSRDQYQQCRKISTTELQEGDLVFFNTRGRGVSHVGVYLGNNKFIHASVSKGVMVSDLFETYYMQRFLGAGRIDNKQTIASN
jgi:lipoprotein Spr